MAITKTNKPKQAKKPVKVEEIDLDPDAWPRFEKLVKDAAKLGPKPHSPTRTG